LSDYLYHESCQDRSWTDLFQDWNILIGAEHEMRSYPLLRARLGKNRRSGQIDHRSVLVVACVRNVVYTTLKSIFQNFSGPDAADKAEL
jgi:hypothetical protein